ncbi:hypothetical protein HPB49_020910 [Dermacentor silvarum]|uniref:Uncharacterized protein n=1 Tax=Dermacentor silvarum TaxID=543639 RepID=A0ACB8DL49_DERSI|nr:hypothetical protein HPB49_020910 [Dermacentor silvarum]
MSETQERVQDSANVHHANDIIKPARLVLEHQGADSPPPVTMVEPSEDDDGNSFVFPSFGSLHDAIVSNSPQICLSFVSANRGLTVPSDVKDNSGPNSALYNKVMVQLLEKYLQLEDAMGSGTVINISTLAGEDHNSLTAHEEWLVAETFKAVPDETVIEERMNLTAKTRPADVASMSVQCMKQKYPYLMDFERDERVPLTPCESTLATTWNRHSFFTSVSTRSDCSRSKMRREAPSAELQTAAAHFAEGATDVECHRASRLRGGRDGDCFNCCDGGTTIHWVTRALFITL